MMIQDLFKQTLTGFSPYVGTINLIMAIIAFLCLAMGIYYSIKTYSFGKWLGLSGCLLLINPVIYFLTH